MKLINKLFDDNTDSIWVVLFQTFYGVACFVFAIWFFGVLGL